MKIVIDSDIPFAREMFAGRGEVAAVPGDAITADVVESADALIVRSPTRVDEKLLGGSRVGFVGTATSGFDHVDREFLRRRKIAFAHAPGCNAESVAEYVTAALLVLGDRLGFRLEGMTIGVVGVGNVGRRIARKAAALGMHVLLNDPPLARKTGDAEFVTLGEVLRADVVTFHVPLERDGPDPTFHLLDAERIRLMRPGSIVINTARGGVVDTAALRRSLDSGRVRAAVLDVWEGEPSIDTGTLGMASIATAHIAGYSADGKVRGAGMMYDALCDWKQWKREWTPPADALPPPVQPDFTPGGEPDDVQGRLKNIVTACCPIMRDDANLRKIAGLPEGERSRYFIGLRNNYPVRREFSAYTVSSGNGPLVGALGGLGFSVRDAVPRGATGGGLK